MRKRRRFNTKAPSVRTIRTAMLFIGLLGLILFGIIRAFPRVMEWMPGEVVWLLLFAPACMVLVVCPEAVVRWAMHHLLRIILCIAGAFVAVAGILLVLHCSSNECVAWHGPVGLAMILFGALMLPASFFGSNKAVDRLTNGL